MNFIIGLIPAPYRAALAAFLALSLFLAGWYAHVVWDGYKEDEQVIKEVAVAREGEVSIVKFNSAYAKEKVIVKDNCIDKHLPDAMRLLLSK